MEYMESKRKESENIMEINKGENDMLEKYFKTGLNSYKNKYADVENKFLISNGYSMLLLKEKTENMEKLEEQDEKALKHGFRNFLKDYKEIKLVEKEKEDILKRKGFIIDNLFFEQDREKKQIKIIKDIIDITNVILLQKDFETYCYMFIGKNGIAYLPIKSIIRIIRRPRLIEEGILNGK